MVLVAILALVDIHTLFVLLFHEYLSPIYVFSGASFAILKGLIFFIPSRDIFSLLDVLFGCFMLLLLVDILPTFLAWIIGIYLLYKVIMSFAFLK